MYSKISCDTENVELDEWRGGYCSTFQLCQNADSRLLMEMVGLTQRAIALFHVYLYRVRLDAKLDVYNYLPLSANLYALQTQSQKSIIFFKTAEF